MKTLLAGVALLMVAAVFSGCETMVMDTGTSYPVAIVKEYGPYPYWTGTKYIMIDPDDYYYLGGGSSIYRHHRVNNTYIDVIVQTVPMGYYTIQHPIVINRDWHHYPPNVPSGHRPPHGLMPPQEHRGQRSTMPPNQYRDRSLALHDQNRARKIAPQAPQRRQQIQRQAPPRSAPRMQAPQRRQQIQRQAPPRSAPQIRPMPQQRQIKVQPQAPQRRQQIQRQAPQRSAPRAVPQQPRHR